MMGKKITSHHQSGGITADTVHVVRQDNKSTNIIKDNSRLIVIATIVMMIIAVLTYFGIKIF